MSWSPRKNSYHGVPEVAELINAQISVNLDFQVWKDGQIVDPLTVIPGYGKGPSGYVYDGTVSSGVMASGRAQAAAEEAAKGSGSSGLKPLPTFKGLKKLGF